jgi:ABC-2 type transport system ATP-binding protein
VRGSGGRNTLHIDFDGDGAFLAELAQVRRSSIGSNSAELTIADGTDPQELLASAMARLRIRRFEVAAPSLEEIFIEKVGTESMAHSQEMAR